MVTHLDGDDGIDIGPMRMGDKLAAVTALLVWVTGFANVVVLAQQATLPPDSFFHSNGVRIRYVDQGQGPAVLLIHGCTGTLERHWINSGVLARLVSHHRVIALDCRGHGKSDKPVNPKRSTVPTLGTLLGQNDFWSTLCGPGSEG